MTDVGLQMTKLHVAHSTAQKPVSLLGHYEGEVKGKSWRVRSLIFLQMQLYTQHCQSASPTDLIQHN